VFKRTTATEKILALNKRIRAVAGGTAASKTISILMWLIDYAQNTKNEVITVVSESYPHLEGGVIRDFKNIMVSSEWWQDSRWNESKHYYTYPTGSIIEFKSIDKFGKAHGPRRDILFVNEANNIAYQIADQLITRTRKTIWLDWNPSEEFWFYTEMLPHRKDIDFITLTYKDNEALDEATVKEIESHQNNKNWWLVYGLGQLGELEGRIYTGWKIIDSIPHEARLERYGLDFGYSVDPTVIIAIYYYNGGYIFDEVTYQKGLSNKGIADILLNQPQALVLADGAEPKSIDEISDYGVNIQPAEKGPGSVYKGIQYVQQQRISVTARSTRTIKSYRNYLFKVDKNGNITNDPDDTVHEWSNACFPAGTKVNGKNIETIGAKTGVKEVYEYQVAGRKIQATPNHKVITQRGVVAIDRLRYNDVVWTEKLLYTRVSNGTDTPIQIDEIIAFIITGVRRILDARRTMNSITDFYGKKHMGKSLRAIISTIVTVILVITPWITYSSLAAVNTLVYILVNGQRRKKDKRCAESLVRKMLTSCTIFPKSKKDVTYAGKNIRQSILKGADSVTTIAKQRQYVGRVPVYNLSTKSGMYRAGGLLVSNCDAIRYGLNAKNSMRRLEDQIKQMPKQELFDVYGNPNF
jgi:phage terminase large subunit